MNWRMWRLRTVVMRSRRVLVLVTKLALKASTWQRKHWIEFQPMMQCWARDDLAGTKRASLRAQHCQRHSCTRSNAISDWQVEFPELRAFARHRVLTRIVGR